MPEYEIHIHCACCNGEHRLLMKVHLAHGPDHKQSIAKSFPDGYCASAAFGYSGRNALCLKTGKKFKVENDEQFLLVPTAFL
jgi:hypothetical protein